MNKEFFEKLRQQGITHIGLAWFEPESFQQVAAVMEDRNRMARTYEEWIGGALRTEETLRREGFVTVRAVLRLEEFTTHCRQHGQRVNAEGRNHFAGHVAAQAQRNSMKH